MNDSERYLTELRALAAFIRERDLGASDSPVILVHAAAHIIGMNVELALVSRADAIKSIDALHDHMRHLIGNDESARH